MKGQMLDSQLATLERSEENREPNVVTTWLKGAVEERIRDAVEAGYHCVELRRYK